MSAPARRARPPAAAVRLTVRGAIAEIRLARGAGSDADVMAALAEVAGAIADRAAVRVVLVAGDDRGGWGGGHSTAVGGPDGIAAVAAIAVPTIALLQGAVGGAGLALALACDLRIAARDVRLSIPGGGNGPIGSGGLVRLARLIGPARAAEMALLGRTVTAREGLDWGLLTAIVERAALRSTAGRMAAQLVARGPLGLRYAKEAVGRALDLPLDDGIRLEQDLYVLLQTTVDRREGVDAFLARRAPRFHGR